MGKKKKAAKMSKGDFSVVSKGFDSMDYDDRDELLAFFDKMKASMENGEDTSEIVDVMNSSSPINGDQVEVEQFQSELSAFIFNDDNPVEYPQGYESGYKTDEPSEIPVITQELPLPENMEEEKAVVYAEETRTMVLLDTPSSEIPKEWSTSVNDDVIEPEEYEEADDFDDEYIPDVNYGIIMETSSELLTVGSRFKTGQTIDLYKMRQEESSGSKTFDDEVKSIIFMNLRTLIKGMMYPDFLMEYNEFIEKFIKIGAPIPDDVYVRNVIGLGGTRYIGMFRFDQDEYEEAIDDLCDYIDNTDSNFFQIILSLIHSCSNVTFKENESGRYFTEKRYGTNCEIGELFIEYCVNNSTPILSSDDPDPVETFFVRMIEEGKYITQSFIRDAAESIKSIFIEDKDEIHEPDDSDVETVTDDDNSYNYDGPDDDYNHDASNDSEIEIEDYDAKESTSVGKNSMSDAIKKSGFGETTTIEDDAEADSPYLFSPKRKTGR